ncbi:unnamed protein product [Urochloa humidicola]
MASFPAWVDGGVGSMLHLPRLLPELVRWSPGEVATPPGQHDSSQLGAHKLYVLNSIIGPQSWELIFIIFSLSV